MISLWLREGDASSLCSDDTTSSTEPTVEPKQRLDYANAYMDVCMYVCVFMYVYMYVMTVLDNLRVRNNDGGS